MFLRRNKEWWDCAIDRAERTIAQSLVSTLPASFAVTPVMLKEADISILYVILAWLLTGFLAGGTSLLTSYFKGIPEVEE